MRIRKARARLIGHREAWGGRYFVTFNVQDRVRDGVARLEGPLGVVHGRTVSLSPKGRIVEQVWQELPLLFRNVELGKHVVMPDHFHGILNIRATQSNAHNFKFKPLGQIVGALKSLSTKKINEQERTSGAVFWQRGFYERIFRHEFRHRIESYIINNPYVMHRRATASSTHR
jgi:putative transposase